jgi:peptidyl-prolyl cis-trans isomerase A (cyclophilin A)
MISARTSIPLLFACSALLFCKAAPPPGGTAGPPAPALQGAAAPTPASGAVPEVAIHPTPVGAGDAPAAPAAAAAAELEPSGALREPGFFRETTAPERFTVLLDTTKGEIHVDVRRSWAPHGADRFYNLVRAGYFDGNVFFRVLDGFVAQVGLHSDPKVNDVFRSRTIPDDPPVQSNVPGMVSFATSGKDTRTTQFFIDLGDNARLDKLGFAPFGRAREIEIARALYSGYGEGAPAGRGPMQARIQREGNAYLTAEFPKLDSIKRASVVDEKPAR